MAEPEASLAEAAVEAAASSLISELPRKSLLLAIRSLLQWIRSQPKKYKKSQLLGPGDILNLAITLTSIPSNAGTKPYRIPIPHPTYSFDSGSASICLILDDGPSSVRNLIKSHNLPIARVISISELNFYSGSLKDRGKLINSCDFFFVEKNIVHRMPRILVEHLYKNRKIPFEVDFSRAGWIEEVRKCCGESLLYFRMGRSTFVKIGLSTQKEEEIVENAVAAVKVATDKVLKSGVNVSSLHVKTACSPAFPVYEAVLPAMGMKIDSKEDAVVVKGNKRESGEDGDENENGGEKKNTVESPPLTLYRAVPELGVKIYTEKDVVVVKRYKRARDEDENDNGGEKKTAESLALTVYQALMGLGIKIDTKEDVVVEETKRATVGNENENGGNKNTTSESPVLPVCEANRELGVKIDTTEDVVVVKGIRTTRGENENGGVKQKSYNSWTKQAWRRNQRMKKAKRARDEDEIENGDKKNTADSPALPVYQAVPGLGVKIDTKEDVVVVNRNKRARGENENENGGEKQKSYNSWRKMVWRQNRRIKNAKKGNNGLNSGAGHVV